MPQIILFPISITTHETTMIVNINRKSQSTYLHLPDIVTECEQRLAHNFANDDAMKITCKQIAHSLRLVADQVDKKHCHDSDFNRNLHYLSMRLMLHSIFCTLWTRSLLPYILLFCKTKIFTY
ncbi:unnamed protein product [Rotaria socialis]|uniref:Uncharacterized protein n=1 Tax=Rotaria socialis TaxID=392032 RepID=A0A818MVU2_9BILA|nr:unnamed protein product [Rotaria socialis]CAF3307877.1 unnamed protein product [Rotaria socialis]CAF3395582.1 unnamed protein product [Rotaria socialis]CAF3595482.1 unnamed protein product [Rotaria socialis]CAF3734877.1 unnamed protein product [Rotaria socialis]